MQKIDFPPGYQQVMPYLIINDAAGFIQFMKDVFDAEEVMKHMRSETVIMHAEIKIGDCVIMFADATEQFGRRSGGFFIYVEDAYTTYTKAIAKGATSLMPVSNQSYGRSGGVVDPYGNQWWVTTHVTTQ
jgi:uncharacterized glyoxalase superfamily protein PhnB